MGITILSADFQTVTQKVAKRPLEAKTLSIEQVPICSCVQVTGLSKETTRDAVFYYFENSKNGGDVANVELNIKEGWALVHFEDPQGIQHVLFRNKQPFELSYVLRADKYLTI